MAAFVSLVSAVPRPQINDAPEDVTAGRTRGCGVHITAARLAKEEERYKSHRLPPEKDNVTTTLSIFFHVVYANETVVGGYVSDKQIHDQVERLNIDYNSTGIRWNLTGIDRIENEDWFLAVGPSTESEAEMKQRRKGDKATLNVFTTSLSEGDAAGVLGYATFPMDYEGESQQDGTDLDGIVLLHSTLPGSNSAKYSMGRTLVHEAGHWCGLYHTFQGGCKGVGDEVDDTPPEESAAYGCMKGRDTCPGNGPDPITNFMDYSDDACMSSFTPGQAKRMRGQLRLYRDVEFK